MINSFYIIINTTTFYIRIIFYIITVFHIICCDGVLCTTRSTHAVYEVVSGVFIINILALTTEYCIRCVLRSNTGKSEKSTPWSSSKINILTGNHLK